MSARRALIILGSIAASVLVTSILVWSDAERTEQLLTRYYLRWGRHLIGQAENLVLQMDRSAEQDRYLRASQILSQGNKNRPYRIYPAQLPNSGETELFELNRSELEFDYVRVSEPRSGQGFRVRISVEYLGFLGSRTPITQDLMILGCFLLVAFLTYWPLSVYYLDPALTAPRVVEAVQTGPSIDPEKIRNIRAQLMTVGTHVKSVFRDCRDLLRSISLTRKSAGGVKDGIRKILGTIQSTDRNLNQLSKVTEEIEEKAIRMIMENGNPGDEMMVLAKVTEELYPVLARIETGIKKGRVSLQAIKKELEACIEQNQKSEGYGEQLEFAQKDLQNHLYLTLEALTEHAQALKKLEQESSPADKDEPASRAA